MVVLIGRFRNILLLHELIIIDIAQKMGFYTYRKRISNWQKVTKCSKSENKRLTNCSIPTIYKLQNVANSFYGGSNAQDFFKRRTICKYRR